MEVDCQTLKLLRQGTLQTDHFQIVHKSEKTMQMITIQFSIIRKLCFCFKSAQCLVLPVSTLSNAVHPILVTVAPGQILLFQRNDGLRLRYPGT